MGPCKPRNLFSFTLINYLCSWMINTPIWSIGQWESTLWFQLTYKKPWKYRFHESVWHAFFFEKSYEKRAIIAFLDSVVMRGLTSIACGNAPKHAPKHRLTLDISYILTLDIKIISTSSVLTKSSFWWCYTTLILSLHTRCQIWIQQICMT